jgi:hypothetical protein
MTSVNGAALQCQAGSYPGQRSEQAQHKRMGLALADAELCYWYRQYWKFKNPDGADTETRPRENPFFKSLVRYYVKDRELTSRRMRCTKPDACDMSVDLLKHVFAGAETRLDVKLAERAALYEKHLGEAAAQRHFLIPLRTICVPTAKFPLIPQTLRGNVTGCAAANDALPFMQTGMGHDSGTASNDSEGDDDSDTATARFWKKVRSDEADITSPEDLLTATQAFRDRYNQWVDRLLTDYVHERLGRDKDSIKRIWSLYDKIPDLPIYVDRIRVAQKYDRDRVIDCVPSKLLFDGVNSFPVPLRVGLTLAFLHESLERKLDWGRLCKLDFNLRYIEAVSIYEFDDRDNRDHFLLSYGNALKKYYQRFDYTKATYSAKNRRSSAFQIVAYNPSSRRVQKRTHLPLDLRSLFPFPVVKIENRLRISKLVGNGVFSSCSAAEILTKGKEKLLARTGRSKYTMVVNAYLPFALTQEQKAHAQSVLSTMKRRSIGSVLLHGVLAEVEPVGYALKKLYGRHTPDQAIRIKSALAALKKDIPWYDPFNLLLQACHGTQQL